MKKYLKQILGESAIYGLSGVITSFIGMFLMPIYTSVFEPRDYGIIALMGTTSTLISMFIIFGMDNAVSLWYWDKPDEKERRKQKRETAFTSAGDRIERTSIIWTREAQANFTFYDTKHHPRTWQLTTTQNCRYIYFVVVVSKPCRVPIAQTWST